MKKKKAFLAVVLVLLFGMFSPTVSKAYFDRGTVGVSVGRSSVSLDEGQSETVSVSFSPSQSRQLPGCGMAECPQSCGEKECLDANGECTCNGKSYQTYYAFASVSSSNTSVATAEYSNGSVTVRGVSAGSATITVTASLRQYNSSSATIKVTVSKKVEETQAPTKAPTKEETQAPTKAPTKAPTQAPTKAPTQAATKAPANNNSGSGTGNGSGSSSGNSSGSNSENSSGSNSGSSSGNHSGGSTGNKIGNSSGSNSGGSTGNSSGNSSGSISAKPITGQTTETEKSSTAAGETVKESESTEESSESESATETGTEETTESSSAADGSTSEITTVQSDRGPITFVPITAGKIGQEQLESILGQEAYVDFQMKDAAGTVLYAWEFCGTDLKQAENLDLNIEMGTTPFEGCNYGTASDSLYLSFGHEGELPGKASVFIKVSEWFLDEAVLNLYSYEDGQIQLIQENVTVENGYATLTLESCSDLILSTEKWEEQAAGEDTASQSNHWLPIAVVIIVVIVAAAAGIVVWMRRKKGGAQ